MPALKPFMAGAAWNGVNGKHRLTEEGSQRRLPALLRSLTGLTASRKVSKREDIERLMENNLSISLGSANREWRIGVLHERLARSLPS